MTKKKKFEVIDEISIDKDHNWVIDGVTVYDDVAPKITMSSNELPDPLVDTIKSLRDKGLNDNRIASRLGITKELVQKL